MPDAQAIVADYEAGQSARQVAATHGVSDRTVLRLLRDAGIQPRKRGTQPAVDPDQVRGRVAAGESLTSIAVDLGVSRGAIAYAASDIRPRRHRPRQHDWRDLTGRERRQLETAWRRLPRKQTARKLWITWETTDPAIDRFLGLVQGLHADGVSFARQGAVLGVHGEYLRQIVAREAGRSLVDV